MRLPWTDADDDALTAMWSAGDTVEAIAAELGRTVGAVNRRRAILGLEPRKRGRKLGGHTEMVRMRVSPEQIESMPLPPDRAPWIREAITEKLERERR